MRARLVQQVVQFFVKNSMRCLIKFEGLALIVELPVRLGATLALIKVVLAVVISELRGISHELLHEGRGRIAHTLHRRHIFNALVLNWNLVPANVVQSGRDLFNEGLFLTLILLDVLTNKVSEEVDQRVLIVSNAVVADGKLHEFDDEIEALLLREDLLLHEVEVLVELTEHVALGIGLIGHLFSLDEALHVSVNDSVHFDDLRLKAWLPLGVLLGQLLQLFQQTLHLAICEAASKHDARLS